MNTQDFISLLQSRKEHLERNKIEAKSDAYRKLFTIRIWEIQYILRTVDEERARLLEAAAQKLNIES